MCATSTCNIVSLCLHAHDKMNHFQRLTEVKELKTRKQASSRRPMPCDALAPTVQNRAGARCLDDTSAPCAEDQQLYNRTSLTSGAHHGSLSKRRELVLSSLVASHSSKGPPSLAYLFAYPPLDSVRWCCRGRAKRENEVCDIKKRCVNAKEDTGSSAMKEYAGAFHRSYRSEGFLVCGSHQCSIEKVAFHNFRRIRENMKMQITDGRRPSLLLA